MSSARTAALYREQAKIWEKQSADLYDLANQIAPGNFSASSLTDADTRERYLAAVSLPPPEVASVNLAQASARLRVMQLVDRVALCRILARKAGLLPDAGEQTLIHSLLLPICEAEEGEEELSESTGSEDIDGNHVIYLRNSYADEAFMRFSAIVPDLRADYASGFAAVCENVYYSQPPLCILPLENSTDGALSGFRSLITRYGLKILSSCDVQTGEDKQERTRFALLSRSMARVPGQRTDSAERFFRFTLIPSESVSLQAVLAAAQLCGMTLYKVDSVPLTHTEEDAFSFDITLHAGGDLPAFAVYLMMEHASFEVTGLYSHWQK